MAIAYSVLLEALIKGGEGSGHFNHAGIPEHQGGSLPSKGPKAKGKAQADPEKLAMRKRAKTAKDNIAKLIAQMAGQTPPAAAPAAPKAAKPKKDKAAPKAAAPGKASFKVPTEQGSPLDDAIVNNEYRTHPLLKVLTGNISPKTVPDGAFLVGRLQKASVAAKIDALAKGTGLTREEADFFYAEWAQSSNVSLFSLGIQEEAAAEFGVPLNAWQKKKIVEAEDHRKWELDKVRHDLAMQDEWSGSYAAERLHDELGFSQGAYPFEAEGLRQLRDDAQNGKVKIKDEADLWRRVDAIHKAGLEKTRKALRFTYDQTQKQLAAAGIKEVRLFRGMKIPGKAMAVAPEGSAGRVESNTLSSWSASYETAASFGYLEPDGTRVVLDAIVPASRIYSTAGSGQGAMNEWEMVVIGSSDDPVRVYKRVDDAWQKSVKGGEGSGHFNHDGIPDHQGGSLPSKGPKAKGKAKPLVAAMAGAAKKPTKPKATPKPAVAEGGFKVPTEQASAIDAVIDRKAFHTDPLLNVMMGAPKKTKRQGWDLVEDQAPKILEAATRALAEEAGLSYEDADAFVNQWMVSSNDSNLFSLGIQEEAAAEFDVPLTDWQKAHLTDAKWRRDFVLGELRDKLADQPWNGPAAAQEVYKEITTKPHLARPFEAEGLRKLVAEAKAGKTTIADNADLWQRLDAMHQEGVAKTRKALRATYDRTQRYLAAAGIKEVRLFRGAILPIKGLAPVGGSMPAATNALSSWSVSLGTAEVFSTTSAGPTKGSAVIFDAIVPAHRVYSVAATGQGCVAEWEMVVLGGAADPVRVYKRADKKATKSALIKGGEGSGHFDHDGIPEHQGGSLPSYGRKKPAEAKVRRTTAKKAKKATGVYAVPEGNESPVDDVLESYSYDHPYLEMYVGPKPAYGDEGGWLYRMRGQRKNEIVTRLSQGTGIPYDECNAFIKQWSISSNDSDVASLTIQEIAADEFGAGLTEWQQANYDSVKATRNYIIDRAIAPSQPGDPFDGKEAAYRVYNAMNSAMPNVALPFEKPALKAFMEKTMNANTPLYQTEVAFRAALAEVETESRAKTRKALRFTYDETQKQLKAAGISEIHLYRGAVLEASETTGMVVGEATTMASNALSSWSFSRGIAQDFAGGYGSGFGDSETHAVIVDAIVPASRIYATATSGPGCLTEWEMIVIGGQADGVRVYSIDEKRTTKSAPVKGGEGSGHFNHAGIPDHQGGSLPSKGPKGQSVGNTTKPELEKFTIPTTMEKPVDVALNYRDYNHPLITMIAGKFDKRKMTEDFMEDDWLEATGDSLKARVVNRLVEGAGLSYDEANDFVRQWAVSSNDSDMASLNIQAVAAKTLGTQLTPWQKANLEQLQIARRSVISRVLDDLDKPDLFTGEVDPFDAQATVEKVAWAIASDKRNVFGVFERQGLSDYVEEEKHAAAEGRPSATRNVADIRKRLDAIVKENDRKVADAVRFTYNETQAALAKAGIKEIHVYRGAALPTEALGFATSGDLTKVASNAISSWSMAYGVADDFSNNIKDDYRSTIIDTVVPASRIYSMPHTGPGCMEEWEVVVIGSKADRVRVRKNQAGRYFSPNKSWAETQAILAAMVKGGPSLQGAVAQALAAPAGGLLAAMIKGGEGSGHFGHAGIPEHQGGSLPSKGPKAKGKGKAKESGDWGPGKRLPKVADAPMADPRLVAELGVEEFTPDYAHRDHPLMRLWAAGEPEFASEHAGPDLYHGGATGPMMKREQARMRQIAKVTGTTKADAENFLTTWLESSNNKHLGSLAIQEEAAALWDAPLTAWQAEKLGAAKIAREKRVEQIFTLAERYHETTDDVFEQILSGFKTTELYPFEGDMRKRYLAEKKAGQVIRTREAALAWLAASEAKGREATRKALAFVYQNTQAAFAEAGITHVMAYRGTSAEPKVYQKYDAGDTLAFQANTLSSWSLSRRVVNNLFSSPGLESTSVGLEAALPVQRIISSAVTGFGATGEWEVVVLGSRDADSGHIYQIKYPPSYKKSVKGGPGSGFRDHDGRPGLQGGSLPSATVEFDGRVWNGETHEGGTVLSKLDTGKMGEDAVIDILSEIYGVPFGTVNVNVNNAPFDVVGDHHAVEVKTGMATNGKSAQQWRATIGQPGKKETELLKNMDPAQKRAHNEWKMKAILDRKHALLDKMSAEAGQPMQARTMGLILNAEGTKADVFSFDGFHLRLPWNKHATNEHYLGTYDFKAKKMHWKNGEKPTKAAPYFVKNTTQSGAAVKSLLDKLTGERGAPVQAAALAAIDADFEQVYAWWTAHYNPKTGLPRAEKTVPVPGYLTMSLLAQLTKGGPGSGNFAPGHRGRPGEQGGSQPTVKPKDGVAVWDENVKNRVQFHFQGRTVSMSGDLLSMYEYGFTPDGLARLADIGEGDFDTTVVLTEKRSGDLEIACETYDRGHTKVIMAVKRTLERNARIARLNYLALDATLQNRGLGTRKAHAWYTALADAGYKQAFLLANSTVGCYAWAKEGAQYEFAQTAIEKSFAFPYWAQKHKAPGFEESRNWPRFANPQEIASYTHPDGFTVTGAQITNEAVDKKLVMPLGKAFMLDEKGHGQWNAVIDLTRWKGRAHKATALPGSLGHGPKWCVIEMTESTPGESDARFWAQYLTEAEGAPLFDFVGTTTKSGPTKGGPGSGHFDHDGIPEHQGGSLPSYGRKKPKREAKAKAEADEREATAAAMLTAMMAKPADGVAIWDKTDKNRVQFHFQGRTVTMTGDVKAMGKYYGLQPETLARLADLGEGDLDTTVEVFESEDGVMVVKGEALGKDKKSYIFKRALVRNDRLVHLNSLALGPALQGRGLGTRKAREWYTALADAGYEKARLLANSTVGRYAWAKEGAQYADPKTAAAVSAAFPEWARLHGAPGFDDPKNYPRFTNPQDVASYQHPDGFTVKGSKILNGDVPKKLAMPLGKAFMLDENGHDQWDAVLDLTVWKGRAHKAAALPDPDLADDAWCLIEMTESTPGQSDAFFWAQYLSEDEGDPLLGLADGIMKAMILNALIKGGEGSGHFDHRGIPEHQGGSLPSRGPKGKGKGKRAKLIDQMTKPGQAGGGSVKLTGEVKRLAAFGLDQGALDRATDLSADGFQAQAVVKMVGADLNIEGTWTDAAGVQIGKFNRTFKPGGEIVILEELALEKPYLGHGLGTKAAHQWFTALAEAGYTRAEMVANSTVGKYAWAKEGAQYKDPGAAAYYTDAFSSWLEARDIYLDDYPVFKTPKDVAEFRHPDGVTISGETIDNSAVPAEAQVPLGKAFMLDEGGHSLWEAVIDLRQWKGKKKK